jgi:hypothetical protein
LQYSIEEIHAESLNAFEKLIAQKKIILKLEYEISKHKEAFESLRDEHASLVNEKKLQILQLSHLVVST